MAFKFEKLEVWQEAVDFGYKIHETSRSFPKDELYVLVPQIKRAADSIGLNIAEGSTGQSNAEFKQFLNYAIRSAIEVVSCLFIAKKRNLITDNDFRPLYNESEVLVKKLQALRKSIK
jgi:four helix bundle protein